MKEDITKGTAEIKRMIGKQYQQFYANKFNRLDEIEKFLKGQ